MHGKTGSFALCYPTYFFISTIYRIKTHLRPLTVAALALQDTNAGLGDVLLTLAHLYQMFGRLEDEDEAVRVAVQDSLSKRWNAADQDVFILGVYFNPSIRASLFKRGINLTHALPAGLNERVQRVWRRFYRLAPNTPEHHDLHLACSDYYHRRSDTEFSDAMLNIAAFELRAQQKVSQTLNIIHLICSLSFTVQGARVSLVEAWQEIDSGVHEGRNLLVKIAIRILSIIANSAGCERLFSQMGIVHTKLRNRLRLEQVRKIVVLKTAIQDTHRTEGINKKRRKRQYGVSASQAQLESDVDNSGAATFLAEDDTNVMLGSDHNAEEPTPTTTRADAHEFIRVCDESDGSDSEDESGDTLPDPQSLFAGRSQATSSAGGSFGCLTQIPLGDLFDFSPPSNQSYIAKFWHQGIPNLEEEMAQFDDTLLASEN